jgi:ferredoxin/flavodoxin---NADP+ reductase
VLEGMFAVGWARKASDGLVGIARHDAEVGATHVLKYLETAQESKADAAQLQNFFASKGLQSVSKADLECLARAEEREAQKRGQLWFKFAEDDAMLAAIEAEKAKTVTV